jgi:hypothetical protein
MNREGFVSRDFFESSFEQQAKHYHDQVVVRGDIAFCKPEPDVTLLASPSLDLAHKILAYSAEVSAQVVHDRDDHKEMADRVLSGLAIPAGMEMLNFVFKISRCSRVFTHQQVRHRMASISQSNSRDRVLPPVFVLPFDDLDSDDAEEMATICRSSYLSYLEMILRGTEPQDARYMLPDCIAQSMVFKLDFKSLMPYCAQRLCINMQPETSFVAWRIKQLVTEMLGAKFGTMLRPGCDRAKACWPIQCSVYDGCGKWPTTKASKTGKLPISQTSQGEWRAIRERFFAEK